MTVDGSGPPLPEHPDLRAIAEAMEFARISGEICDSSWRLVFISSEEARIVGVEPSEVGRFYGKGLPRRQLEDGQYWATTDESSAAWWDLNVPFMRNELVPGTEAFEAVFGALDKAAALVQPADPPRAWSSINQFPDHEGLKLSWLGDVAFIDVRINGDDGAFLGVMRLSTGDVPDSLLLRLARGDVELYERMAAVADPRRRSAAILFADLEASGELSRRLSSRAYFDLVSELTDLIDSEVIANGGIVGKHAGDGSSALFLTEQLGDDEGRAAAAAVRAGRRIRDRAGGLAGGLGAEVNVGLHWGATLMVGQVATGGRLEVTALGDEMNETARIEGVAHGGALLASKHLVERLAGPPAADLGIDPDAVAYTTVAELAPDDAKAIRDAGTIAIARL